MNNERFTIPEILFNPMDVGVNQMGLAEAIMYVINEYPKTIQPHLLKNIVLTGGSSAFPGLKERVYNEVRSLASTDYTVNVTVPSK